MVDVVVRVGQEPRSLVLENRDIRAIVRSVPWPNRMIDKHTIALISIIGCSLDLLGTLYLAYDLLGGEHGPLRNVDQSYHVWRAVRHRLWTRSRAVFGLAAGATAVSLWAGSFRGRRSTNQNQASGTTWL